jgi:hypothetical protein
MLNSIEDKANNVNLTIKNVFNSMTDRDFIMLHNTGQLKNFCNALSLDLQPRNNEKDYTYTA